MEKNNKGLIVLVAILSVIILGLVCYIAYDKISENDEKENIVDNNKEENKREDESNLLDSNIIVTQNGKVISNEIPSDLVGKYINKNDSKSYIQLINGNVEVSEPTGGVGENGKAAINLFKDEEVKLYINFLNKNESSKQYVTVEFYVENNGYNKESIYTYIGKKSSYDNKYHFETPYATPVGGEQGYPYEKQ